MNTNLNTSQAVSPSQQCMSVDEFAQTLGVSHTKARSILRNREIAYSRIGRRIVITHRQFQEYLERNEVPFFNAKTKAQRAIGGK